MSDDNDTDTMVLDAPKINPYVSYLINRNSVMLMFSCVLSFSVVCFCIYKLSTLPDDSPNVTIYMSTLTGLIGLWTPVQIFNNGIKTISDKIKKK